ncbi:MAG: hypothetical protein V3R66_04850 [Rhodospirillales bacterium]
MTDGEARKHHHHSSSSMKMEFKRAVAAAAMTKLMETSYNEDAAAHYVNVYLGGSIYPSKGSNEAIEALKSYRGKITAPKALQSPVESIALSRVHYDATLKGLAGYRLAPLPAAQLLIKTMLVNIGMKPPIF